MALSPTERTRLFRERHLGPDGGKVRLEVSVVEPSTLAAAKRIARRHALTITAAVELALKTVDSAERHAARKSKES